MDNAWRGSPWQQFGATLDMFGQAMDECPDELWQSRMWGERSDRPELSELWYVAYHTLFWLDLYLSGEVGTFTPPAPFGLSELDPAGALPERSYTKSELQTYLAYCRQKCSATIDALTDEQAGRRLSFGWGDMAFAELLLYNMRHVQEHGAQLRMYLGQQLGLEPGWGARARG
jgi:uncharacterized damage-inducible protein DinB